MTFFTNSVAEARSAAGASRKVARGEAGFLGWITASLDKAKAGCADDEDEIEESVVPLDETNY